VNLVALDTLREAMQHAWALTKRIHDSIADIHVVLSEVELGRTRSRKVHAIRVADPDVTVTYFQLYRRCLARAARHSANLASP
jgi:hypothetical protein